MNVQLKNKLLRDTAEKVEAGLTPEARQEFLQMVVAGMRMALHDGAKGMMGSLRDQPDTVEACAKAAVNLVQIIRVQSGGTAPQRAMPPAALVLMLHGLDFAEQANMIDVDMDVLVRATKTFTNVIFASFNITPQMIQEAGKQTANVTGNDGQMEIIRRRAGLVRDPRASTPTLQDDEPEQEPRNRAERRRKKRRR